MSSSGGADYIFYGGEIITMDEQSPSAESLAVHGEKIVGVGSLEDIESKWKGEDTKIVSLNNQVLMPGLIEPHQHAVQKILLRVSYVDINGYDYTTYDDTKTIITNIIAENRPNQIAAVFFGWDPEIIPNMPTLTRTFIDENYSNEIAVVIIGQSGHIGWANTKAFEKAEIQIYDEDPDDATFDRKDGYLTGKMLEIPAITKVTNANIAPPKFEDLAKAQKIQWMEYAAAGITTTTDLAYMTEYDDVGIGSILEAASRKDGCCLRLYLYTLVEPDQQEMVKCCSFPYPYPDEQRCLRSKSIDKIEENSFLKIAGVKIVADGSPHAGTMATREPFLKSNLSAVLGFPEAPCYGHLKYSHEDLNQMVSLHHKAGKQLAIHAHGERACDQVLRAYEQVLLNEPESDRRHRMEHLGLMTEEQIKRASQMKLGLSFFVNHLYFYGTSFSNFIFGPERTKRWTPCSLGTKYSLHWTLHQDHPTHPGPLLPFASMQTAVTRTERFRPDTVYGPEYCVSIHEALKAYTINAAWQLHAEKDLGSLTVNKQADLLILGENPYNVDPLKLENVPVLGTFVAGRMNDDLLELEDQNGIYVIKKIADHGKNNKA